VWHVPATQYHLLPDVNVFVRQCSNTRKQVVWRTPAAWLSSPPKSHPPSHYSSAPAATPAAPQPSSPAPTPAPATPHSDPVPSATEDPVPHPSRSSPLSPDARPFFPATALAALSLEVEEEELEHIDYDFTTSPSRSPRSYMDALLSSPNRSPLPATVLSAGGGEQDMLGRVGESEVPLAATRKQRRRLSRCIQRRNPPPPLVATLSPSGRHLSAALAARLGPLPHNPPPAPRHRPWSLGGRRRLPGVPLQVHQAAPPTGD
jgi:hypothetical protein